MGYAVNCPLSCLLRPSPVGKEKGTSVECWVSGPGRCCLYPRGTVGDTEAQGRDVTHSDMKEMDWSS